MGVDLHTIGNHNFTFDSYNWHEVSGEILYRLNKIQFSNKKFLRLWQLHSHNYNPIAIRNINITTKWELSSCYHDFNPQKKRDEKYRHLSFKGVYGLKITIYKKSIYFHEPHIRYMNWFEEENNLFRNEWRKYFKTIITAFGGDRVVYLPDCTELDNILDYSYSFPKIEKKLNKKYGVSKHDFEDIYPIIDDYFYKRVDWYFIDGFVSSFNTYYPIKELLPEPTEYDNMGAFDLEKCKKHTYLFDIVYSKEYMLHKKKNNQLYFCHLAYRDDLLVIRKGKVGSSGEMELTIDKEMPFKFDEIYYKIREEKYTSRLKFYKIKYDDADINEDTFFLFLEKLRLNIILKGIGLIDVEDLTSLSIINKKIFLKTLSNLIEKENEVSKFKIVVSYSNKTIFNDKKR